MLRHTVRLGRVVLGACLVAGGAVLMLPGIPGPGILVVASGLYFLGHEFEWARRAHERLQDWGRRLMRRSDG